MPKPQENEKKNDFIRRCVHELVHEEGKSPKQAVGMCYGIWNTHEEKTIAEKFLAWLRGKPTKSEGEVK